MGHRRARGNVLISKLEAGFLSASSALALGAASVNAQTPSWSMYQPYTNSTFVPFVSALSSTQGALVNLAVGPSGNMSSPQAVTMDTGSIGLQVSADNWNPGNLTPIGPGSINLNSSGVTNSGNFYSVPVNFFNGGTNVATANVPVLVVTKSVTCPPGGSCTTNNDPRGVFYMGVGLNRTAGENLVTPNAQLVNGQTLNPFLNIAQIPGQAVSASTIRQGYIINTANGATGGVTLGLTQQNTQGMSFVKLGANASGSLDNWNTAPMSVTVTNGGQSSTASSGGNPPSGSGVLPDAGINYMFLSPVPSNVVTQSCTLSGGTRNCLPDGAQVQVSLPGSGAASGLAQYSFTVGGTGSNVVQPAAVVTLPGSAFVNTGREFFLGFQYLYDLVGGYVGYAAQPGLGASGSVNLGVALIGQVDLADNFSNSLPVFLIGDTTLAQTGSGSITSAIAGAFGLTIGSGSVTLGGANTYTGGTTVAAGASLIGTTSSLQGNIVDNGSVTFSQATAGTYAGNISGIGSVGITGGGTIIFSGTNSYTGPTSITGGRLAVNGSITSNVTVGAGGNLGGTGTIFGGVTNGGVVAPGNSIGTLNVVGSLHPDRRQHLPGRDQQRGPDRPHQRQRRAGTATIAGGTVTLTCWPRPASYAPQHDLHHPQRHRRRHRHLRDRQQPLRLPAAVAELRRQQRLSHAAGRRLRARRRRRRPRPPSAPCSTPVRRRRHRRLRHRAGRAGDPVDPAQGQAAMTAISGQNYSGFGSAGVQSAPALHEQLRQPGRRRRLGGSTRVALAEACDVACDVTAPGVGRLGRRDRRPRHDRRQRATPARSPTMSAASPPASTAGRRPTCCSASPPASPPARSGSRASAAQGTTDTFQAGLYGSFTQGPVYVDALAGYAYSDNQMWRQIAIPGLRRACAQRPDRRQPVLRPARGRLPRRARRHRGGLRHAVRPPAGLHRRRRTASPRAARVAQPQRRGADHQLAALRAGRPARRRDGHRLAREARAAAPAGLEPRIRQHGRPVTAAFAGAPALAFTTYGVVAAARRRAPGLLGQHRRRRRDLALPPLRRRSLGRRLQPRPHRRRAHDLVEACREP